MDPVYEDRLKELLRNCKVALMSTEESLRDLARTCRDRKTSDDLIAEAASIQDFLISL